MTDSNVINLEPKLEGQKDEDPFVLQQPDLILVQVYIEAGMRLPKSQQEIMARLNISQERAKEFSDIVQVYSQINEHCTDFHKNVYPESVKLAGDIVSYATFTRDYYTDGLKAKANEWRKETDPVKRKAIEAEVKAVADEAKKVAGEYAQHVEDVKTKISNFVNVTEDDERKLTPLSQQYKKKYDDKTGELAQVRKDIKKFKDEIEENNKQYEYHYYKAYKEPAYYGWCTIIGAAVAIGMLAQHSKLAKEFESKVNEFKEKLKKAEEKEKLAVNLMKDLDQANGSLKDIKEKLKSALPILQRIKGLWEALAKDMDELLKHMERGFTPEKMNLLSIAVDNALRRWDALAKKADNYRAVAFIRVVEEEKIPDEVEKRKKAA